MREDIQEDWLRYHEQNPHVYAMFEKFALQVADRVDHYSAKAIVERLRWHYRFEVKGDWEFKITNTHTTPMARHFIERNPHLEGFFSFKTYEEKEPQFVYEINDQGQARLSL